VSKLILNHTFLIDKKKKGGDGQGFRRREKSNIIRITIKNYAYLFK